MRICSCTNVAVTSQDTEELPSDGKTSLEMFLEVCRNSTSVSAGWIAHCTIYAWKGETERRLQPKLNLLDPQRTISVYNAVVETFFWMCFAPWNSDRCFD